MVEQLNIFYEFGLENDPFYCQLLNLKKNEVLSFGNLEVVKNNRGLYEISNNEIHDCFSNVMDCYKKIESLNCPLGRAFT